jgi:hypothetical protein
MKLFCYDKKTYISSCNPMHSTRCVADWRSTVIRRCLKMNCFNDQQTLFEFLKDIPDPLDHS